MLLPNTNTKKSLVSKLTSASGTKSILMDKLITYALLLPQVRRIRATRVRSYEFAVLIVAFFGLTTFVASGLTTNFDKTINLHVRSLQGNERLDMAMIAITSFGDVTTLVVIGVILTVFRRTRKVGLIFLITIVFVAITVMYFKPIIGRQAPAYNFQTSLHLPKYFALEDDSVVPFARGYSYPSNHVAVTTALAFIVGFAIERKSRVLGILIWVLPVLVAFTKLYLMQHYVTDLIGGFLLGLIISIFMSNAMHLDQPFLMSRFKGKE
jgi:undecaprenyl-diphosphatase